ncbi:hypothetical protein V5F53_20660 [Xanthobacter sp. V4C-4]|uniref:hypothetical protein n=1 Tax=Xanthobacter cornucopiae TaxID=3119924 RepID=UPI0037288A12
MQQRVAMNAVLSEDRQAVRLSLDGEADPAAWVELDAAELSQAVERLAALRGNMVPEVVRELDPGARIMAIQDPIWRAVVDDGRIMLAVRHPGLGWLAFELPPGSAASLGHFLVESASRAPASN